MVGLCHSPFKHQRSAAIYSLSPNDIITRFRTRLSIYVMGEKHMHTIVLPYHSIIVMMRYIQECLKLVILQDWEFFPTRHACQVLSWRYAAGLSLTLVIQSHCVGLHCSYNFFLKLTISGQRQQKKLMSKLFSTQKSIVIPWEHPLTCQQGEHSFGNIECLLI